MEEKEKAKMEAVAFLREVRAYQYDRRGTKMQIAGYVDNEDTLHRIVGGKARATEKDMTPKAKQKERAKMVGNPHHRR